MFPKRGAIALVTTVLALMLLFQFKPSSSPAAAVTGPIAVAASPTTGASSTGTPSAAPVAGAAAMTITGSLVSTQYGDVEVQVTVASGKITAVRAIALPSGGRSGQISSYAAPVLANEAVASQSASINTVSGATYTSRAYASSLQAALDKAGIAMTLVTG